MKSKQLLKKFDENCNSGSHPLPIAPLRISVVKMASLAEAPDLVFMLNGKSHLYFRCVYDLVSIGAHLINSYVHYIL